MFWWWHTYADRDVDGWDELIQKIISFTQIHKWCVSFEIQNFCAQKLFDSINSFPSLDYTRPYKTANLFITENKFPTLHSIPVSIIKHYSSITLLNVIQNIVVGNVVINPRWETFFFLRKPHNRDIFYSVADLITSECTNKLNAFAVRWAFEHSR